MFDNENSNPLWSDTALYAHAWDFTVATPDPEAAMMHNGKPVHAYECECWSCYMSEL